MKAAQFDTYLMCISYRYLKKYFIICCRNKIRIYFWLHSYKRYESMTVNSWLTTLYYTNLLRPRMHAGAIQKQWLTLLWTFSGVLLQIHLWISRPFYTASIKRLGLPACRHIRLGDQGYFTQRTRHTSVKE